MESVINFQSLTDLSGHYQKDSFLGHNFSAQAHMESIRTQLRILKNLETLENTIEYSTFGVV